MLKKIGIISLSFLLCACSLGVQLKKSMFTIELGKDIYANPTLYLKNATFSSRLKVVSKSVGVDKKNNRFMTSGMDYLVVGEYDFAIVDGSKEYPFVIKVKDTTAPVCASEVGQITIGVGQNVDWNSYFHATDLSGVTFEANVDTSTASTQDVQVKNQRSFWKFSHEKCKCGRSIMKKADEILIVCIMIVAVVLCVPLFFSKNENVYASVYVKEKQVLRIDLFKR